MNIQLIRSPHIKQLMLIFLCVFFTSCLEQKTKEKSEIVVRHETKLEQESNFTQQKITDNLYVIKSNNYNTNVGVFIGNKEIILIDPMTGSNNHQALLEKIKEFSNKPIKYVINTHDHEDHTGANSFFAELGATIISQENIKYTGAKYDLTFKNEYTLDLENERVELYHITSHTFDDVLIYFTKNNTIFMGDTYMTNFFPHFYYGGGSKGHIDFIDKALSLGNENTVIVAGHGKLSSDKTELNAYRKNSIQWIERIKELSLAGKAPDEITQDEEIKQLALTFTGNNTVHAQTIEKTISVDYNASAPLPENAKNYEGMYQYKNGEIDELIFQDNKLMLRRKGAYIFELSTLSDTKFHIKGQVPYRYISFSNDGKELTYFNGKESQIAKRK
ncbi:MBL fold metallo-hydrolase [Aquimarina megaterium]|uniref:MBL fold metallo-hydrolase n=1 Tax=Aquimarina megaterium TaxID=1443666 RepID=UPI000471B166|nr:MBL fold metallo-hydrolase [Aquimarina megaterium]